MRRKKAIANRNAFFFSAAIPRNRAAGHAPPRVPSGRALPPAEKAQRKRLKAFYFDRSIFIQSYDAEIMLNRVRIFNLSGQEILEAPLTDRNSIPFNDKPNGIYFAEVTFNSTERRILKIVKY